MMAIKDHNYLTVEAGREVSIHLIKILFVNNPKAHRFNKWRDNITVKGTFCFPLTEQEILASEWTSPPSWAENETKEE